MRPIGHTEHGKLSRAGVGEGGGRGLGGLESATATAGGRRGGGSVRLPPPSLVRQDATVGQSP